MSLSCIATHRRRTALGALAAASIMLCAPACRRDTTSGPAPGNGGGKKAPAEAPAGASTGAPAAVTAPAEGGRAPDTAAALVNGSEITAKAYAERLAAATFLAKQASFEGRMSVVQEMVNEELVLQDGIRRGFGDSPQEERIVDRVRRLACVARFNRETALAAPRPTDAEVDRQLGTVDDLLDLSVVAFEEAEKAEEARRRVLAGESLEKVADELSSPIAQGGGKGVGKTTANRGRTNFSPAQEDAIFALKQGELSDVIPTGAGFFLVRLDGRKVWTKEEIADMRQKVYQALLAQAVQERIAQRRRELTAKIKVEVLVPDLNQAARPDCGPGTIERMVEREMDRLQVARADGKTITLADLFGGVIDYRAVMDKSARGIQSIYLKQLEKTTGDVAVHRYGHELGWDRDPEVEADVAVARRSGIITQWIDDAFDSFREDSVSDTDAEAWYRERAQKFPMPESVQFSQILMRRKEEADAVRQRLARGEEFGRLARELSAHPCGERGGDMGWVDSPDLRRDWGDAGTDELLKLARAGKRDLAEIRTNHGYHLILISGFKETGFRPYAEVKAKVRPEFIDISRTEYIRQRILDLRKGASITINEDLVRTIEPQPRKRRPGEMAPHVGGVGLDNDGKPGGMPGMMPGRAPGGMPGMMPGGAPGRMPPGHPTIPAGPPSP